MDDIEDNPLASPEPPQIVQDLELSLEVIPRRKRRAVGGSEYTLRIYGDEMTASREDVIALRDWIDYLLVVTSLEL